MKNLYVCPECEEVLNTANAQLKFIITNQSGIIGSINISPEPGNYSYSCSSNLQMEEGELVDFSCPHCKKKLISKRHEEFVGIKMMVNEYIFFEVIFSRRKGVRKTYVITEDLIEEYGDSLCKTIGYRPSLYREWNAYRPSRFSRF